MMSERSRRARRRAEQDASFREPTGWRIAGLGKRRFGGSLPSGSRRADNLMRFGFGVSLAPALVGQLVFGMPEHVHMGYGDIGLPIVRGLAAGGMLAALLLTFLHPLFLGPRIERLFRSAFLVFGALWGVCFLAAPEWFRQYAF